MLVVCALLCQRGKILIAQRPTHKSLAGLWEFPGGKVKTGESNTQALSRELKEELDISISAFDFLGSVTKKNFELHAYVAEMKGSYKPLEHRSVAWLNQIHGPYPFPLCESDEELLKLFGDKLTKNQP